MGGGEKSCNQQVKQVSSVVCCVLHVLKGDKVAIDPGESDS